MVSVKPITYTTLASNTDKRARDSRLKIELRRLTRDPLAVVGVVVWTIFIVAGLLAPIIAPYDPLAQDLRATMQEPSWAHLLGTDNYGRDVLSRIIYGARVSILVGMVSVAIAVAIGGLLGLTAGITGGRVDTMIMRIMDILLAFPTLLIALLVVAIFKPSIFVVMLAVGISATPNMARLMRAEVLTAKEKDYVEAAHAIGVNTAGITFKHVLPNVVSPIIVAGAALLASAILTEANLSFLGLGVPQDVPSWGGMINEGRNYLLSHPLLPALPGIAIMLLVAAVNFLGDYLRDTLDPRYRKM